MRRQIINDTLPALAKLRKEGLVRYVGFSGLPLDAFTYVLDRCAVQLKGSPKCGLASIAYSWGYFGLPLDAFT